MTRSEIQEVFIADLAPPPQGSEEQGWVVGGLRWESGTAEGVDGGVRGLEGNTCLLNGIPLTGRTDVGLLGQGKVGAGDTGQMASGG